MELLKIFGLMVLGFAIAIVMLIIFGYIISRRIAKKNVDGNHHCNSCEKSFIYDDEEIDYRYCPYCGQELEEYQPKVEINIMKG